MDRKRKDIWIKGETKAEIYRSSYSSGYRATGGRWTSYKIRGVSLGVNNFGSRADAHKFLTERGFLPLSTI